MDNFAINLKHTIKDLDELALVYTPGVGLSSKAIAENKELVNLLTNRKNSVAVIFDCKKHPESYLPFTQAVCAIIKKITNLDSYPLVCFNYDINKLIENLEPTFNAFYVFSNASIKSFSSMVISNELEDYDIDTVIENAQELSKKIESDNLIELQQNFLKNNQERALSLRATLNGVIDTENIFKTTLMNDFCEMFSKEKLLEQSETIGKKPELAHDLTQKHNTIAIITDGSAVLGLGNIGAEAALPVMEGKAAIFKALADINAIPICLKTQNINEIIEISAAISPSFGGINLEDINAPRCFEIEEKLIEKTNIPIFHDDQHGTAIVVLAGLLAALEVENKQIENIKIVMSGAGAAAQAVAKLLIKAGAKNLILTDINGVVNNETAKNDNHLKKLLPHLNPDKETGMLKDVLQNADVLIGLSAGNIVSEEMIQTMNEKPIVFALANPIPEIMPDKAMNAGAYIVATGRSDFPNQINNSLAFPGVFNAILKNGIKKVTDDIKYEMAKSLYNYTKELGILKDVILPKALDKEVVNRLNAK